MTRAEMVAVLDVLVAVPSSLGVCVLVVFVGVVEDKGTSPTPRCRRRR